MSNIFESKFGPEYKQLFKDGPSNPQDVSNTARILVSLSSLSTSRSGGNELDQVFWELNQKVLFQ